MPRKSARRSLGMARSRSYIVEDGTQKSFFIDANPRLVEPMNALLSGVDLAELLEVSLGRSPPRQAEGNACVLTRLGMMGLMDAANRRGLRRDVVREIILLASGGGRYRAASRNLLLSKPIPDAQFPYVRSRSDCCYHRPRRRG